MEVDISEITGKEFIESKLPVLFSGEGNRRFAKIKSKHGYLVAWASDLINLTAVKINNSTYAIGVDQDFLVIDLNSGVIKVKLNLFYNFYQFLMLEERLLVVTELEIIELDRVTHQVIREYSVPEIIKEAEIIDGILAITCINEEKIMW